MRNLIPLITVLIFFNCKNKIDNSEKKTRNNKQIVKIGDSIIRLNEDRLFYFSDPTDFGDGNIRFKKRFLLNNKRDTIGKYEEGYSEVWVSLSPNKQFLITDGINIGYVQISKTDSILHDVWGCFLIKLDNGEVINSFQSACDGEWNSKNEWISGGEIIFNSLED